MYFRVSRAESFNVFVVDAKPHFHKYVVVREITLRYLGAAMFTINKGNLTENHQQAPTVNASDPCAQKQKKGTSQRKIESNRRNSLHSTGPGNTQRTRYNALKHGLLAAGLTQWDDAEKYEENIHALTAMYPSSDPVVTFLIEQMALEMVRSRRTARLEAETITLLSCRPDPSSDPSTDRCTLLIDPGPMKEYAGPVLDRLQRYASAILNRMLRCRRALEPIRRDEPGPGVTDTDIANADIVII
jgi:hypothetical protein